MFTNFRLVLFGWLGFRLRPVPPGKQTQHNGVTMTMSQNVTLASMKSSNEPIERTNPIVVDGWFVT